MCSSVCALIVVTLATGRGLAAILECVSSGLAVRRKWLLRFALKGLRKKHPTFILLLPNCPSATVLFRALLRMFVFKPLPRSSQLESFNLNLRGPSSTLLQDMQHNF